jgi:hypothetical protein
MNLLPLAWSDVKMSSLNMVADSLFRLPTRRLMFIPEGHRTRTHARKRATIQIGRPFWIALVGRAREFIYSNGALCYTLSNQVLDFLHLDQADKPASFDIPGTEKAQQIRPLHYADGYISILRIGTATQNRSHHLIFLDRSDG